MIQWFEKKKSKNVCVW